MMVIRARRHTSWPSLVLMAGLIAALSCSRASSHEVEDEHEPAHQSIRSVEQLVSAFRETGDDEFLDLAWAQLVSELAAGNRQPDILINAATVAQARHQFDLALVLVRESLAQRHHDDQAWLLLASIHLVQGQAENAARACRELRRTHVLVAITCHARVALARDDGAHSQKQLSGLLQRLDLNSLPPEVLAWSLSVAGDLTAQSRPLEAIDYYQRSIRLNESTQVRSALIDVLLSENKLEQARQSLPDDSTALPLLVRRLIIADRLGFGSTVNDDIARTDREFRKWIAKEDWLHAREMARFYLDVYEQPQLARRLAMINLTLQREPEDLRLEQRTKL